MKKLFILLFLSFFVSLQASMIDDFRKAQRLTLLSEFKSLYKQRHISAHTAALKHKYSRVKRIKHPSLRHHIYVTNDDSITNVENSSIQTKANNILEEITHKSTDSMHHFTKIADQTISTQDDISQTITTDEQISITTQDDILQTLTTESETSTTNQDETTLQTLTTEEETSSTTQDDTTSQTSDTQEQTTSEETSTSETQEDEQSSSSQDQSAEQSGIRPLYANPWRRR